MLGSLPSINTQIATLSTTSIPATPLSVLQLKSVERDDLVRRRDQEQTGRPKTGPWSFRRSGYSPAVYLLDEADANVLTLRETLAHVGKGGCASVA